MLAEAFNCDPNEVPDSAQIGNYDRWDSLAHLRLILAIEEKINRQLDPDEMVRITNLNDIACLLTA